MESQEVKVESTSPRAMSDTGGVEGGSGDYLPKPVSAIPTSGDHSPSECMQNLFVDKSETTDREEPEPTGSMEDSQSKPKKKKSKKADPPLLPNTFPLRKLPGKGLNRFGFFDYDDGLLLTRIIPRHKKFMLDTGILAMDCEMVGVGPMKESALARISIVNEYGYCLYDKFVKPSQKVTDYRTEFSGIRKADLKNAVPFVTVRNEVRRLIKRHILVGHSLENDLLVLSLSHPKERTRNTAQALKTVLQTNRTPALRTLTSELLGVEIQQGEHCSIIDAQATMALYRLYQDDWEESVSQKNGGVDFLRTTQDKFKAPSKAKL